MQAQSSKYPWLSLKNGGNDLVFTIGGVPCRFSNDDPHNPTKPAVLIANRHQRSFFEDIEDGEPCRFCFVIDRGINGNSDPFVVFMGFDSNDTQRCQWACDSIRALHSVDNTQPATEEVRKAIVTVRRSANGDVNLAEET